MNTEGQENNGQPEGGQQAAAASEEQAKPFYSEFGFEDEASFVEHYKTIASKTETQEAPAFKFGILKDIESFLETEISTGADEETALAKTIEMVNNVSKPWAKMASTNPLDVLVESEARKYPGIPKEDIKEALASRYGLDEVEPDKEDDPEEHAKWMKRSKVASVKAIQDATEAAKTLEESKAGLKVHPKVLEQVTLNKQYNEARASLAPEYTAAVSKAVSSFEVEIEGIKIPVKFTPEQVKMLSSYDPLGFATSDGKKIDAEKVGGFLKNFAVAGNFDEIAKALVNHGKSLATGEIVTNQRNPGEQRRAASPNGDTLASKLINGLKYNPGS